MAASHGITLLRNATSSGSLVDWPGGVAQFIAVCAGWNLATVALQQLGADGSSLVDVGSATTLTANGNGVAYLPPCQVQATIRGAVPSAGVYAALGRVVN